VHSSIAGIAYTLPYFAAGVVMSVIYERLGTRNAVALACVAGLAVSAFFGVQKLAFAVFGAYLIVHLAQRPNIGSRFAGRFGDLSYGLYLFGWPVEQVVKQVTATDDPWYVLAATLPLVFAAAACSYHLVERPALSLKARAGASVASLLEHLSPSPWRRRVFHAGATVCAAIAIPLVLLSEKQWWFVTDSVAGVALAAIACGAIAAACAGLKRAYKS
jgi:peptidoglycan/LPS O-acetylase OafA/YrhL